MTEPEALEENTNGAYTNLAIDDGVPEEEPEQQIEEYEIASSPNDFNIVTIANFMDQGSIIIPGFQRHYVWDIKRASKLIESLILGLPIPQIFLYEEDRNRFLVIDGQQRLMSIYFFVHQRFPRKSWRTEIRNVFNASGRIPEELLRDDHLFQNFNLSLGRLQNGKMNKFHGLNYSTLREYRSSFDLRTIRNIIVRQLQPKQDDSSIYEMFNRLNSGGMNLKPQEIRASMYHSDFFDFLFQQNTRPEWRRLLATDTPDLHMRDIEVLLRALAMHDQGDTYRPSMTAFLNRYCKQAKSFTKEQINQLAALMDRFFGAASELDNADFRTRSGFSLLLFESVFAGAVAQMKETDPGETINPISIQALRDDEDYRSFTERKTNDTVNVKGRLGRGRALVRFH